MGFILFHGVSVSPWRVLVCWAWLRAGIVAPALGASLILTALAFGIGLSPLGGLLAARITAAAFGLSLMALGIEAWRHRVGAPASI